MGFFTDLKDDLSQAVNELMPEEELAARDKPEKRQRSRMQTTRSRPWI